MASEFPVGLDTFVNPQAGDPMDNPAHDEQHANLNDAMAAVQAKLGIDDSVDTSSIDYRLQALENAVPLTLNFEVASGAVNGSNTAFTFTHAPSLVFLSGVLQRPGIGNDYTLSGLTVTFTIAPEGEDIVSGVYLL